MSSHDYQDYRHDDWAVSHDTNPDPNKHERIYFVYNVGDDQDIIEARCQAAAIRIAD